MWHGRGVAGCCGALLSPSVLLHVCAGRVVPPEPAEARHAEARHDQGHDACTQGGEGGASQLPSSSSTGAPPVSKLVCLANLLSAKVLASDAEFSECVHDIRTECGKFGRIETFVVPRERALEGRPASDVGKCFIAYADEASAARSAPPPHIATGLPPIPVLSSLTVVSVRRAVESMNLRQFDGLVVQATLLPA